MPRPLSNSKRQQGAANVRDTRHDNGLVGPGKRVPRQKSNGHMNGHANSSDSIPSTPPPSTPPPANGHAKLPGNDDNTSEHKLGGDVARRTSVGGHSDSSQDGYNIPTISFPQENHRHINVNSAKNPSVHRDSGPWHFAKTVLTSCPISDTLAILIVLLQVPPAFLTIIQLLFATLTFVPPSTTATSGISFIDMFEGTTGTPSLATIMVVDVLFLLTWVFLYGPLQEFILQFAQSVIALTLGGGLSGKEAGMRNVVLCFGYIGVSHYASISNIKSVGLRTLLSSPRNFLGSFDLDDPLESIPIPIPNWKDRIPIWVRNILAVHILAQGVVRYIRDLYVRSQKRDHAASTLGDPEAAKGSADGANDSSTTNPQTPDNEASNSLHASHTAITTRKKRKQSAQVRIQQPLWAALASTKIVMVKEYETSHAAAESAGTNATDASNLGNAPFSTEPDRIWITNVGSDAVLFSTSYFPKFTIPDENQDDTEGSIVNSRMPIFVRVNQAHWQPTRMEASINPSLPAGKNTCWDGEIFGLAPSSSYEIEFFNVVNNKVIFCTSVKTLNTPSDTAAATSLSPLPPQVSGRPGSPSSTIQQSIRASKTKLEEERSRQKRERKDQRTKIQTLRREIDKLSHIIATSGGNDEKQRQKIQQATLQIRQADEAITSIQADIEIADRLPSASKDSEYISAKQKYRTQKELYEKAKSDFTTKKKENEKPITALSAELLNKERQSEKLEARSIKLTHQADDLREANTKGLNEVQRREKQRKDKDDERRMVQANWDKYNVEAQMQLQRYTDDLTMLYPYIDQYTMALQQQHQQEANQLYVNSSWTTAGESSMSAFPAYAPISGAPGGQQSGQQGNHALQDYQMQLMLLEQQNKKRLMMARQEQGAAEGQGGPGGPGMGPNGPNFPQGASPQSGPRSVNSPNPSEQQMKRGTPHMNNPGIPSPLPEGQNRGSPGAMNFNMGQPGQMDAGMNPQFYKMNDMNGNMMPNGMRPPSSHPGFPQGMSQQQMMMARQQAGNWQNGPNGGAPMVANPSQGPPQAMGTPQQRNMPPPAAPANAGANGRTQPSSPQGSTAAPPTPQQSNKANPKKKNETKETKTKKGSAANLNAGATPSADPTQEAATPTPATPITPIHAKNFGNGPNPNGAVQPVNGQPMATAPNVGVASSQPDPLNAFPMNDQPFDMLEFNNPMNGNSDVLTDFDFDSFLNDSTGGADDNYNFDPYLGENEISETV